MIPSRFLQVSAGVTGLNPAEAASFLTGLLPAPITIANLLGEGLQIDWTVEKTRRDETGEIRIYNLNPATLALAQETYRVYESTPFGFQVALFIGWEGNVSLLAQGVVWYFVQGPTSDGVDNVTTIRFGEGYKPAPSGTLPKVHTFSGPMAQVSWSLLGVEFQRFGWELDQSCLPLWTAAVTRTPLPPLGGLAIAGEVLDNLTALIDTMGLEWKVVRNKVILLDKGITQSAQLADALGVTILQASTGLLDFRPLEGDGLEVDALALPHVQPGAMVSVFDRNGQPVGLYRVDKARFTGTTEGQSDMTLTCRKAALL
jgi:hypothetical protein